MKASLRAGVLFLFFFAFSCSSNSQNDASKGAIAGGPAGNQKSLLPDVEDPYFVETGDTVSKHGPGHISRNILQDANGNYWFATWEGIIRYDGKQFTNITLKEGLRHFHTFSLLDDHAGNLWFGMIGGGVYRYDGKKFVNFTTKDGLAGDAIGCMLKDKAGNIWIGTENGPSRYDGKIITSFASQEEWKGNTVNAMAQDRTGKIWLATDRGVYRYDGKTFTPFFLKSETPFHNARTVIEDKSGNIWIGSEDGLFRYDGKSVSRFWPDFTSYIMEDKAGNLWFSAAAKDPVPHTSFLNGATPKNESNGMALYRYDGKVFTHMTGCYEQNDNQLFGVYEDAAGNTWFGTMKGVCRYDGKSFDRFTE